MVRNDVAKSLFDKAQIAGKHNEYVVVGGKDSNHTLVSIDSVLGCDVMNNVVKFFDKLVQQKEQRN